MSIYNAIPGANQTAHIPFQLPCCAWKFHVTDAFDIWYALALVSIPNLNKLPRPYQLIVIPNMPS
jgi:hypothetical protein